MAGRGDPSDPTWNYIARALIRGRTYARSFGHTWRGDSCAFVNSLALGLVMDTRNGAATWRFDGGPVLEYEARGCIELAYADHYLHTRMVSSFTGAGGRVANAVSSEAYDKIKATIADMQKMGDTPFPSIAPNPLNPATMVPDSVKVVQFGRAVVGAGVGWVGDRLAGLLQENPNAKLSTPTAENSYWTTVGSKDGYQDFDARNFAQEIATLKRFRENQK